MAFVRVIFSVNKNASYLTFTHCNTHTSSPFLGEGDDGGDSRTRKKKCSVVPKFFTFRGIFIVMEALKTVKNQVKIIRFSKNVTIFEKRALNFISKSARLICLVKAGTQNIPKKRYRVVQRKVRISITMNANFSLHDPVCPKYKFLLMK